VFSDLDNIQKPTTINVIASATKQSHGMKLQSCKVTKLKRANNQ